MRQSKLFIVAVLLVSAFVCQPNMATAVVGSANSVELSATTSAPALTKKQARKFERLEKRFEKMTKKKYASEDIGMDDPAKTWLVRWLVLWGVAIVIGILAAGPVLGVAALSYLSYVIWTLGSVCAIIWLLKILEVI